MARSATDKLLRPPARFSNALVLALGLIIAFAMATAIGHRGTLIVGLVALTLFIAAFWGFYRDEWLLTIAGTVLVVLGGVVLLLTPIVAWARADATAQVLDGVLFRTLLPLAFVAAIAAIALDVVPSRVTDQDGPAFVGLGYTGGLALLLVVGVLAIQFGLATFFETSISAVIELSQEGTAELLTLNAFTSFGGLILLAGVVLWLVPRVARLPLVGEGVVRSKFYWRRLRKRLDEASDQSDRDSPKLQGSAAHGGGTKNTEDNGPPGPAARNSAFKHVGTELDWARISRILGIVLFWGGFALIIAGIMPEPESFVAYDIVAQLYGPLAGDTIGPQRLVAGIGALLLGIRVGHVFLWKAIHLDWAAHQRRAAYLGGSLIVLLFGAALGSHIVDLIVSVPALHILPDGGTQPLLVVTEQGLEIREPEYGYVTFEQHSAAFVSSLQNLVDLVGAELIGIASVALLIIASLLVLILVGLGGASSGLSNPGAGIGLLFVGTAGAAALGAPTLDTVVAAGAALLAADANSMGTSLQSQLDGGASTLRGEVVHMTATAIVIAAVMVIVVAGTRLVSLVPTPEAEWQLFGALWLYILAAVIAVLMIGFSTD